MEAKEPRAEAELYAALAKAQSEFKAIAKNREVEIATRSGGKFKFRYADLEQVIAATRPALAKNGLAVIQLVQQNDGRSYLVSMLTHSSGASISSAMLLPESNFGDLKNDGAAISYLRRYAYCALLCVAADDDLDENGEEAQQSESQPQPQRQRQQAPRPTKPDELQLYPDELFDQHFAARRDGVAQGATTPEKIISMIETKYRLTDEQRQQLMALEGPKQ